jgi:TRAP-type C4-dicarboxylate transport system substrate-binding protein
MKNQMSLSYGLRCLVVLIGVAATTLQASAANKLKVNLGTLAPRGSIYHQTLQAMGEQWREAPGMKVQLNIHTDGRLGGEADMVRLMRNGTLQAGLLTAVGLSEIEPGVTGLQSFPMAFRNLEEVDYINTQLSPMLEARLEEKGFVVLFWLDAGWVRFFSCEPMLTPDDLRRMKVFVWAGNPDQVDLMREAKFRPVALETADIGSGLRTGLIDVAPLPPIFACATQVCRPGPHMLEVNWAPLIGAAIVRKDTWESLPESARKAMLRAAEEAGAKLKARSREESNDAVKAMRDRGLTVHAITPEIEKAWRTEAEKIYPDIRGTIVPEDIYDEVLRLLKVYRESYAAK